MCKIFRLIVYGILMALLLPVVLIEAVANSPVLQPAPSSLNTNMTNTDQVNTLIILVRKIPVVYQKNQYLISFLNEVHTHII